MYVLSMQSVFYLSILGGWGGGGGSTIEINQIGLIASKYVIGPRNITCDDEFRLDVFMGFYDFAPQTKSYESCPSKVNVVVIQI